MVVALVGLALYSADSDADGAWAIGSVSIWGGSAVDRYPGCMLLWYSVDVRAWASVSSAVSVCFIDVSSAGVKGVICSKVFLADVVCSSSGDSAVSVCYGIE